MNVVQITVPADLLEAAGVTPTDASIESAKLIALELYREGRVSMGRAALEARAVCAGLGLGERRIINLALSLGADLVWIDDRRARNAAKTVGLKQEYSNLAVGNTLR